MGGMTGGRRRAPPLVASLVFFAVCVVSVGAVAIRSHLGQKLHLRTLTGDTELPEPVASWETTPATAGGTDHPVGGWRKGAPVGLFTCYTVAGVVLIEEEKPGWQNILVNRDRTKVNGFDFAIKNNEFWFGNEGEDTPPFPNAKAERGQRYFFVLQVKGSNATLYLPNKDGSNRIASQPYNPPGVSTGTWFANDAQTNNPGFSGHTCQLFVWDFLVPEVYFQDIQWSFNRKQFLYMKDKHNFCSTQADWDTIMSRSSDVTPPWDARTERTVIPAACPIAVNVVGPGPLHADPDAIEPVRYTGQVLSGGGGGRAEAMAEQQEAAEVNAALGRVPHLPTGAPQPAPTSPLDVVGPLYFNRPYFFSWVKTMLNAEFIDHPGPVQFLHANGCPSADATAEVTASVQTKEPPYNPQGWVLINPVNEQDVGEVMPGDTVSIRSEPCGLYLTVTGKLTPVDTAPFLVERRVYGIELVSNGYGVTVNNGLLIEASTNGAAAIWLPQLEYPGAPPLSPLVLPSPTPGAPMIYVPQSPFPVPASMPSLVYGRAYTFMWFKSFQEHLVNSAMATTYIDAATCPSAGTGVPMKVEQRYPGLSQGWILVNAGNMLDFGPVEAGDRLYLKSEACGMYLSVDGLLQAPKTPPFVIERRATGVELVSNGFSLSVNGDSNALERTLNGKGSIWFPQLETPTPMPNPSNMMLAMPPPAPASLASPLPPYPDQQLYYNHPYSVLWVRSFELSEHNPSVMETYLAAGGCAPPPIGMVGPVVVTPSTPDDMQQMWVLQNEVDLLSTAAVFPGDHFSIRSEACGLYLSVTGALVPSPASAVFLSLPGPNGIELHSNGAALAVNAENRVEAGIASMGHLWALKSAQLPATTAPVVPPVVQVAVPEADPTAEEKQAQADVEKANSNLEAAKKAAESAEEAATAASEKANSERNTATEDTVENAKLEAEEAEKEAADAKKDEEEKYAAAIEAENEAKKDASSDDAKAAMDQAEKVASDAKKSADEMVAKANAMKQTMQQDEQQRDAVEANSVKASLHVPAVASTWQAPTGGVTGGPSAP